MSRGGCPEADDESVNDTPQRWARWGRAPRVSSALVAAWSSSLRVRCGATAIYDDLPDARRCGAPPRCDARAM